jgi:predicted ABC-type exoprotein transport system permease subunit
MENGTFVAVFLVWIAFFILAIPLARRIRHPDQRPFAAYLIFVSLFTLVAGVLFALLSWLAVLLGLSPALERLFPAIVFLLLVFAPALFVATWQARKPRWRRPPPA